MYMERVCVAWALMYQLIASYDKAQFSARMNSAGCSSLKFQWKVEFTGALEKLKELYKCDYLTHLEAYFYRIREGATALSHLKKFPLREVHS